MTYIYLEMPNFSKAETELQNNFDKWMYILQQLPYLQNRPKALQERVFQKLFEAAEIAKFTPDEKNKYEESLKYRPWTLNAATSARLFCAIAKP